MTYFDKSDELQRLLTEFYALQRPIEDYLASQCHIKISQQSMKSCMEYQVIPLLLSMRRTMDTLMLSWMTKW